MFMELYKMGYVIFPAVGKIPAQGVSGFGDWARDGMPESEVERFERDYPLEKFNLALVCGPASNNTIAIDCDSVDKQIQDACPKSPLSRVGMRGFANIMINPFGIESRTFERKNRNLETDPSGKSIEGVEVRGCGLYMIIPPSIHPDNGRPYTWVGGHAIDKFNPDYIPPLLDEHLLAFEFIVGDTPNAPRIDLAGVFVNGTGERCPTGSQNRLKAMASGFIAAQVSIEKAVDDLLAYDEKHHRPTYFSDKTRNECRADPRSNAAKFYSNILSTHNANRLRKGVAPQVPRISSLTVELPGKLGLPEKSGFERPSIALDKKGKPIQPPHQVIADHLVRGLGDNFRRDKGDPFSWHGTHWRARDLINFKYYIQNTAQDLMGATAKQNDLSSVYSLFMNSAPALADNQSFYLQDPFLVNFLDGTLEIRRNAAGMFCKNFRKHSREDLLTWVLPYEYSAPRPKNNPWQDWLARAFWDDPDCAGKIQAMKQIGGACLVSAFPRLALFVGPGGTGKSTFAKLCMKFIGKDNYSSIPPHLIEGFHMESMINKQANIVTDIGKDRVGEAFLKLVEDNVPTPVNRKGKPIVFARMPAVHIFCANSLPPGIDGDTNAMDRRVTIIEFTHSMLGDGGVSYTRDYEDVLLSAGPGAILDFFEDGLDDLIASGGLYFNPESGVKKLEEWKSSESIITQFIEALVSGEIGPERAPLIIDADSKIIRSTLSRLLSEWAGGMQPSRSVNKMFSELERRGFVQSKIHGRRFVHGIKDTSLLY